jgi:hypothetical protein
LTGIRTGTSTWSRQGRERGRLVHLRPYDGTETEQGDGHLHAPINASGSYADLSHIDFCYKVRPGVSKIANPSFTRTYKWKVAKSMDKSTFNLSTDGTANYTVSVDKGNPAYVDSG